MSLFKTEDLDLAAAIVTATGETPDLVIIDGVQLTTFAFPDTKPILNAVVAYQSDLQLPARKLLMNRQHLFRRVRQVKGGTR